MNPQFDRMESLLGTLGEARRDGAFSSVDGRYPWQASQPEAKRFTRRRLAWARVVMPLTAAAAVAVVFVGPSLFETPAVHEIAEMPAVVLPDQPEAFADAVAVTTSTADIAAFECDYNDDGQVDGRDIQAFVDRVRDAGLDLDLEREYFQRCLLGNS